MGTIAETLLKEKARISRQQFGEDTTSTHTETLSAGEQAIAIQIEHLQRQIDALKACQK